MPARPHPPPQKPGVIFHRTLGQEKAWWDREGEGHWICEMDRDYIRNVIRFLERQARSFYIAELLIRIAELKDGWVSAIMPHPSKYGTDALSWLRETPLLVALYAELLQRKIDEGYFDQVRDEGP